MYRKENFLTFSLYCPWFSGWDRSQPGLQASRTLESKAVLFPLDHADYSPPVTSPCDIPGQCANKTKNCLHSIHHLKFIWRKFVNK